MAAIARSGPLEGGRLSSAPQVIDRNRYAQLCRLLTLGKGRAGKGACHLDWQDLAEHSDGLIAVLLPDAPDDVLAGSLARLHADFADRGYATIGLTLRQHPVAFLRGDLAGQRIIPCRDLLAARDGQRVTVAGLVFVRQRSGTATGVVFITIEDETGIANLVVWSSQFERQRRVVLSASMLACHGRVQREGDVIHVVTDRLDDLSGLLKSVGGRSAAFPLRHGRGDEVTHQNGPDPREVGVLGTRTDRKATPAIGNAKGLRMRTRDFR